MNEFMSRLMKIAAGEDPSDMPGFDEAISAKPEKKMAPEMVETKKEKAAREKEEEEKLSESKVDWIPVLEEKDVKYLFDNQSKKPRVKIVDPKGERIEFYSKADLPEKFDEELDKIFPEFHGHKVTETTKSIPDNVIIEKLKDLELDHKKSVFKFIVADAETKRVKALVKGIEEGINEAQDRQNETAYDVAERVFDMFKKGQMPKEVAKFLEQGGVTKEQMDEFLANKAEVERLVNNKTEYKKKESGMLEMLEKATHELFEKFNSYEFVHGGVMGDIAHGTGADKQFTLQLDIIIGKIKALSPVGKLELMSKKVDHAIDLLVEKCKKAKVTKESVMKELAELEKVDLKKFKNYTNQLIISKSKKGEGSDLADSEYYQIAEEVKKQLANFSPNTDYGPDFINPDREVLPKQEDPGKKPVNKEEAAELLKEVKDIPTYEKQKPKKKDKEAEFIGSFFHIVAASDLGQFLLDISSKLDKAIEEDVANIKEVFEQIKEINDMLDAKEPKKEEAKEEKKELVNAKLLSSFDKVATSEECQKIISDEIASSEDKGKSKEQAAAIGYSKARGEGCDIPKPKAKLLSNFDKVAENNKG